MLLSYVFYLNSHLYEHLASFLFHFKNSLDSQLNVIQSLMFLRIVIICIQSNSKKYVSQGYVLINTCIFLYTNIHSLVK